MKYPVVLASMSLAMLLAPGAVFGAEAEKPIKLYMNEKLLVTDEVAPKIVNGNTIVPVRVIVEEIGAKISWDEAARKVTIVKDDVNIQLVIDSKVAAIQGKQTKMEVAPVIMNGNTMLPLRFVGELMGVKFNWDQPTSSVHMFKEADVPSKPVTGPVADGDNSGTGTVKPGAPAVNEKPTSGTGTPAPTPKPPAANGGTGTDTAAGSKPADANAHLLTSIELTDKELIVKAKDGTLVPTRLKLSGPNRIVFDFPNMVLDDSLAKKLVNNIGELDSKHPLVQKVRFSNFSDNPSTVRVILDLKGAADYRIQTSKKPNEWSASIEEHRIRVVIDAGHGAKDPGALSVNGRKEKDFTLAMAKKVSALLAKEKQIEVLMTRSDDTFVELDDRVAFANDNQVDVFLSIHGNKANKANISGTETYYYNPESLPFANVIHKYVSDATGLPDRGVRIGDFRVVHKTTMPAVLVEVGYLSNKGDEAAMYSEAFQDQVAASLVSAIKEYLNVK